LKPFHGIANKLSEIVSSQSSKKVRHLGRDLDPCLDVLLSCGKEPYDMGQMR